LQCKHLRFSLQRFFFTVRLVSTHRVLSCRGYFLARKKNEEMKKGRKYFLNGF